MLSTPVSLLKQQAGSQPPHLLCSPLDAPHPTPRHPSGLLLLSFILSSKVTSAEKPSQTASIKSHLVSLCLFNLLKFSS